MKNLTSTQKYDVVEQYVDIIVDNMDTKTLAQIVTEQLVDHYDNLSNSELKIEIEGTHGEELYDELVDNVTNETTEVK
tara:strand:+ start:71 stop:304 length:234 start_codon:yes stop_codon:yes gene_type:complete